MKSRYKKGSNGEFYPIIDLFADYRARTAKIFTLVDSGATISIFKPEVAKVLGLKIESGKPTFLGGVGGRIKGYIHELELDVAGKLLKVPVVFSYEYNVSLNLLGRAGIFKNFKILFDEKNLTIEFK